MLWIFFPVRHLFLNSVVCTLKKKMLFYVGCSGSLLLHMASPGVWRLLVASLWEHGLQAGAQVVAHGCLLRSMWDLPGPETEPSAPALCRWILNPWTTTEVPVMYIFKNNLKIAFESMQFAVLVINPNSLRTKQFCVLLWFPLPSFLICKMSNNFLPLPLTLYSDIK